MRMDTIILYMEPTLTLLEFDGVEKQCIQKLSLDIEKDIKEVFIRENHIFLHDSQNLYQRSCEDLSLIRSKKIELISCLGFYQDYILVGVKTELVVLDRYFEEINRISLPRIKRTIDYLTIYQDVAYLLEAFSTYNIGLSASFYPTSIDLSGLPKELKLAHSHEYKLGESSRLLRQFLTLPKANWGILAKEYHRYNKRNPDTQSIKILPSQGESIKDLAVSGYYGRHGLEKNTKWYQYDDTFSASGNYEGKRKMQISFSSFYLVNIISGPPHWAIVVHKEKYIYLVQAHLDEENITYSHFIYLDTFPPLFPQEVNQVAWVAQKIQLKVLGRYVWVFYKNLKDEDNIYILQAFDSKTYPHPPIQYIVEGDYKKNESRDLYDFDVWTDTKEGLKADSLWGKLIQKITSYFSSPKQIKNKYPEAVDLYLKELEEEAKTDTGKIKQLLTSGEKKNIELAFQLCKSLEGNYEAKVGRWLKKWPLLCIQYGVEQDYFQGLDRLRLKYHELEKLPPEVMQLTNLKYLDVWGNPFSEEEKERIKKWAEGAGVTLDI